MPVKELEKRIEDMRIEYAKEYVNYWCDNIDSMDAMSREDWLSIYTLLLTKENT